MRYLTILLSLTFLIQNSTFGDDYFWLSEVPPADFIKKVKPTGMQKLPSFRGERGKQKLILWIKEGRSDYNSKYLSNLQTSPDIFAFHQSGEEFKTDLSHGRFGFSLTYNWGDEGYYNLFLVQKNVVNNKLIYSIAKSERLHHYCRNGHKNIRPKLPPKSFPETVPFEIVRQRMAGEDFHTILKSGDKLTYSIFLDGKPVKGAKVIITSQNGWIKELISDDKGEVKFQLIEDYFTDFKELEKEKIYHFLVMASYEADKSGIQNDKEYSGTKYVCSMEHAYQPSPTLYKSYVWPLIIILGVMILLSVLIYIKRQKRKNIY